ncbi:aminotransferase class V-fold PLP-dependent enzyme [Marinigracilibium pacificum]|uniref:Aminotransferase class V-fold PLP-dependent enzyme n=1 Tax=Marinigracilibium pacificum TaxID=2729599 RepID=A0A848J106_9BACT|nr:aminotransferase class V-fold PLP-dependent enzyme [Marinigracilibium pacificum]NMM48230.1 aminotransferase class V-fold PLP-dependent enzyme [Marinigracilibium pacificum]
MNCQKHLFSLDHDEVYLNCAYMSPLLNSTQEVGIKGIRQKGVPTRISTDDFFQTEKDIKNLYSNLINCSSDQIAIIPSTSYGLASVFNNIKGQTGQEIIIVKDDFPSSYYTVNEWCKKWDVKMVIVDKPDLNTEQSWTDTIINSINERTSIIAIPTTHWVDGTRFDLKKIGEICQKHNIKLIVDGTQSVGAVPIDVMECNIYALVTASYKWMFGPYNIGLLYISPELNNGDPIEFSWMNRINSTDFTSLTNYTDEYNPGASRYNVGEFSNFILLPMLKDALLQLNSWTVEAVNDYCSSLTSPIINHFKTKGYLFNKVEELENHLLGINLPSDSRLDANTIAQKLKEKKISVSVRKTLIRISPNVYNSENDIAKFIEILDKFDL